MLAKTPCRHLSKQEIIAIFCMRTIFNHSWRPLHELSFEKTLSKEGQILLGSLQKAVAQTLEKKKRFGQYAVVWQEGKLVIVGEDVSKSPREH